MVGGRTLKQATTRCVLLATTIVRYDVKRGISIKTINQRRMAPAAIDRVFSATGCCVKERIFGPKKALCRLCVARRVKGLWKPFIRLLNTD